MDSCCEDHVPSAEDLTTVQKLEAEAAERKERAERHSYLKTPIPGLLLIPDFVTPEEENVMMTELDGGEWSLGTFRGTRMSQHFGTTIDYAAGTITKTRQDPVPPCFEGLFQKMRDEVPAIHDFFPNQLHVHSYERRMGHSIGAHVDDRQFSGPFIGNLSLVDDCYMTFSPDKTNVTTRAFDDGLLYQEGPPSLPVVRVVSDKDQTYEILLPRRSLSVMMGDSRFSWKHAVYTENLLGDRRISVTMRQHSLGMK